MKNHPFICKELPTEKLEEDLNQPRKEFGTEGEKNKLAESIRRYGIEDPIKVTEVEPERYIIIDGHRRYQCAKILKLETVPCRIYPKMGDGELEGRRYEMQNNRRKWKPEERAEALSRIKDSMNFRTNKELAFFLQVHETSVANTLQWKKEKTNYLDLMNRYALSEAYRTEFLRLKQKLRKIRDFEASDIILNIFERVRSKVIKSSRDFRTLGRIFLRATANEEELHRYLSTPEMTVSELEQRTIYSGSSLLAEKLIQDITAKSSDGRDFSEQERAFYLQLYNLMKRVFFIE